MHDGPRAAGRKVHDGPRADGTKVQVGTELERATAARPKSLVDSETFRMRLGDWRGQLRPGSEACARGIDLASAVCLVFRAFHISKM